MTDNKEMCTYLFKDDKYYKIGRSTNVLNRFINIKYVNIGLKCVSFFNEDIEKELHRKFDGKRVAFEWFDLSKKDVEYILTRFGNPNIDEIKYLDCIISDPPYKGRYLVSMGSSMEINWLKSKPTLEYRYWVKNHLRFSGVTEIESYVVDKIELTVGKILKEINEITDLNMLVSILEVAAHKLEINTISEMARLEGKSPNGIRQSKNYRKINVGKQVMVIKGLRDSDMPF